MWGSVMDNPPARMPVTDSPWFWLVVFLCGSLVALILTGPKFSWRQPQLERQYRARQNAGQTVSTVDAERPLPAAGNPTLTLRPLVLGLVVALVISMILFWIPRFRRYR